MRIHTLVLTDDEILALLDSVSEETVRMRRHVKENKHSERAVKRLNTLEALLADLKDKCYK